MKRSKPINVNKFSTETLNIALNLSLKWGEDWLKPIQVRIQKLFPEITDDEADTLNRWCIEAREYAFALVEEEYPLVMAHQTGTAMERVKEKYPQIDEHNLATLYNQGMYYAWHG